MKTAEEIKARIEHVKADDWLGTQQSDLIDYLPYADAKEFLNPEVTEQSWLDRDVAPPLEAAKKYLEFAWGKANGCRGLSAGRSLDHLKAWLWLGGYGDIVDVHFEEYEHYGKKQLFIASLLCGFDFRSADDGAWVNFEDGPSISQQTIDEIIGDCESIVSAEMQTE